MKFLLTAINAKFIHSNPAIYSLRACAGEELQPYVELAEFTINESLETILEGIWKRQPDVIGFSCYIWNWKMVQEILAELPKILPETEIWLGGPEVTYDGPGLLKKFPQVTGIMVGEGEATFRELLGQYLQETEDEVNPDGSQKRRKSTEQADHEDGQESGLQMQRQMQQQKGKWIAERFGQIPGLCLASGYTQPRELTDLTTLPFLYEDMEPFTNRIIYYETSRGCPYRCSYCLSSIDKKVRLRDISVVKKELQFFLDQKVKQVKFIDRTFNCDHKHAMEIWQYIYEHDNGVTNFHFEISADILREEEIALLNRFRPGLAQLEIGVQSTNPETIHAIHRVMDVDKLERIVAAIHRGHNIHQHLDLIAGLPYEDYESFGRSFDRVYGMQPEQLQLGFLKVLKGSDMHEHAQEYGIRYLEQPPYEVLYTNWISYGELRRLKRIEEMVELYYNSGQFTHTLPFLEKTFPGAFAMYEALADFYQEQGYFTNSPARSYRYQILLTFAGQYDPENSEIYRELLTYDMYLRENLKSRPAFAVDDTESTKEEIRQFYQTEEQERKYLPAYTQYDWKQLSRMTHLEPFCYPVWDMTIMSDYRNHQKDDQADQKPRFVLFDYQSRNPLNYEAMTQVIIKRQE